MPWDLLLFPLLGGYLVIQVFSLTRFRAQQLQSYRLLIESAIFGIPLVLIAKLLWVVSDCSAIIEALILDGGSARSALGCLRRCFFCPLNAEAAFISFLLGILIPVVGNWFVSREWAMQWNYEKHGDTLYKVLNKAFNEQSFVSLTLDTRKVYICLITQVPNLEPFDEYLKILPLNSGYRDPETMVMTLNTPYYEAYTSLFREGGEEMLVEDHEGEGASDELNIVIPVESIKSANLFSEKIYAEYFSSADQHEPQRKLIPHLLIAFANWWSQRDT